jgi:RHS repeat-associated protein
VNNQSTGITNGSATPLPVRYDAVGNVKSEGESRHYVWNHAGRLVGFRTTAGSGISVVARYLYAADGSRVKKWVRCGGSTATDESCVYLGGLAEHHRWAAGGGGSNSHLHIVDGAARVALLRMGPPHPDDASPAVRYELSDHLGSSSLVLDSQGSWTNREEYFPYGETSFGGFARKRYRFTGREADQSSGLTYHVKRWYALWFHRWNSCDPLWRGTGSPYCYAGNSPMRMVDPNGEAEVESAASPQPPEPELNFCRGSFSDVKGHHGIGSAAVRDPATGKDPFRRQVTTISQTQGDLTPERHQAASNLQNRAWARRQGVETGAAEVAVPGGGTVRVESLEGPAAMDRLAPKAQAESLGTGLEKPGPSPAAEEAIGYYATRATGASRAQALRIVSEDVAERAALAAASGKSPIATRAPGGPGLPQLTEPIPAGGLDAMIDKAPKSGGFMSLEGCLLLLGIAIAAIRTASYLHEDRPFSASLASMGFVPFLGEFTTALQQVTEGYVMMVQGYYYQLRAMTSYQSFIDNMALGGRGTISPSIFGVYTGHEQFYLP